MPNVRNIIPKKERGTGKALRPFSREMEDFFEDMFPRRWSEGSFSPFFMRRPLWGEFDEKFDFFPKVDILDKDDALLVRAEMPGVKKEDLDITIAGDRLVFEAKRDYEEEEKKEDFVRHERCSATKRKPNSRTAYSRSSCRRSRLQHRSR
jgi:HSP20 family protein